MIEKIISDLKDKKILILGFGVEGKSTYRFIRKFLNEKEIYVYDSRNHEEIGIDLLVKEDMYLKVHKTLEKTDYSFLNEYDLIIKSPGISFRGIDTTLFIDKIVSQVELFLKHTENITIGITGTKGKSTTSSLLYFALKGQGKNVKLVGNIGIPIFDEIEQIKEDEIFVIELSSHQLQYIKHSPKIALLLNVFEDHLDHYNSYREYVNSKINILKYQKKGDYLVINLDNEKEIQKINELELETEVYGISTQLENEKEKQREETKKEKIYSNINYIVEKVDNYANILKISKDKISVEKNNIYDFNQKRKIIGRHNEYNIMFVLAVLDILKLDIKKASEDINNFSGLPHRMEYIGTIDSVKYYDDSIATIPEATISVIQALEDVDTVIIGGMDRNIHYDVLVEYLAKKENLNNIILMYETGKKISEKLKKYNINKKINLVEDIYEAVKVAKQKTKKGKSCVMSPAAASYTHFKNFEERGNIFKELVFEK